MTSFRNKNHNSSRKLQLESLENRELLSVSGLYNGDAALITASVADDKLSNGVYNAGKDEIVDAAAFGVKADTSASSAKGTFAVIGKTENSISFKAYDSNVQHYGYLEVTEPSKNGIYLSDNAGIIWGSNVFVAGGVVLFTGLKNSQEYVFFYDSMGSELNHSATIEHGAKFAGNVVKTASDDFVKFAKNGLTATSNTATFTYTVPVTAAGTNTTISAAFNGASKATNYAFGAEGKLFTYTVKNGKITLSKNAVKGITWETGVDNTVTIKGLASGKTQTIFKIDGATATIRATTTGYGVTDKDSVNFIPTPGAASLTVSFTAAAENRAEVKNAKNTVITTGTKYQVVLQTGKTLKKVTITSTADNTDGSGIITAEITGLKANTVYTLVSIKTLADAKTVKKDGANTTSLAAGKTVSISGKTAITAKAVLDKPTLTLVTTEDGKPTASSLTFKTKGAKKGNNVADTLTVVVSWKEGGVAKTATFIGNGEPDSGDSISVLDEKSGISATYTVSMTKPNEGTLTFTNLKAGITYTVSAAFSNAAGASKSSGRAVGTTVNSAAVINSVTIGGKEITAGTPSDHTITGAGTAAVSLSSVQAQQADFVVRTSEGAKVKYYKQLKDNTSVPWASNFTNTWTKQDLATGDTLWVEVTSQDGTAVNYYKFAVTVLTVPASSDAALYAAQISGKSVSFGNPAATWDNTDIVTGKVSLTASQAQSAVLFSAVHSGATVEWAYTANETNPAASFVNGNKTLNLTTGGYVWIKVTAKDGETVRLYKFSVEKNVNPSHNAELDGNSEDSNVFISISPDDYIDVGTPAATWDAADAGSVTVFPTKSEVLTVYSDSFAKVEWAFTASETNPAHSFQELKRDARWDSDRKMWTSVWESVVPLTLKDGGYVWIKVTAEDGTTVNYYKIKVTAPPSDNATLDYAYIGDTMSYGYNLGTPAKMWNDAQAGSVTLSCTEAQSAVLVAQTLDDTRAKVEWTFTDDDTNPTGSFQELESPVPYYWHWESTPLTLTDGGYVWIKVTAEDNTVLIYKIKVTVAKPSNDATLYRVTNGNDGSVLVSKQNLGIPAATWNAAKAGSVTLTSTQAQNAYLWGVPTDYRVTKAEWAFTAGDTSPMNNFTEIEYDEEGDIIPPALTLTDGSFVWVRVTAEDGETVLIYKIKVTVEEPSHDAALEEDMLICYERWEGYADVSFGTPAAAWNAGNIVAGSVTLTSTQVWLDAYTTHSGAAKVEWAFTTGDTDPESSFVVPDMHSGNNWYTYSSSKTLTDGGYVWIRVTAEDGETVLIYKIKVTVTG